MARRSWMITAALALAIGASSGGPALAADPAASPEQVHGERVGNRLEVAVPSVPASAGIGRVTDGRATTLAAAGFVVTCRPDAQNPHISTSARYVIYKTRVTCTGTGSYPPKVTIRVRGGLMWDSAKYAGDTSNGVSWSQLRSSNETRIVSVNGSVNTFYTPKLGESGAYFTGHHKGSSTVEILTPVGQVVGSDISNSVFLAP